MKLPFEFGWQAWLLAGAFVSTVGGTAVFRSFALQRGIVATPNYRSLHQRQTPRGGGIVFSAIFLCVTAAVGVVAAMPAQLALAIIGGGAAATLFGFIDDVIEIGLKVKLAVQALLAGWALYCFGGPSVIDFPGTPAALDQALTWLALVWMMNLYNFMDGVDGMAASGAVFFCAAAIVALLLTGIAETSVLVLALLGVCSLGFLVFNWPPASVFMGDSGSLFLGYCFGVLIVATASAGQMSVWTWLIILAYFGGDTTTTTLLRIISIRRWYGAHRSHAYQNLARIWSSHLKVVRGVALFHLLWLLPLAVWSCLVPHLAPLATALAWAPVIVWTFRYGPRLSSA